MSIDLNTLQLLKYRDKYDRYIGAVPVSALAPSTQVIIKDFGRWLREFDGAAVVDLSIFPTQFAAWHPTVKGEQLAVYDQLFKRVRADVAEHLEAGLPRQWVSASMASKLAQGLERYAAGEEVDIGILVKATSDEYEMMVDRKIKNPQVLDAIEDMLFAEEHDHGITFPWASINKHIKPMVGGDFIVLAMRPDKGKSTMCSQIVTHAAHQIDNLYPDEQRSILWFNNEGPGKRIVQRNFQSALNATIEDLILLARQDAGPGYEKYRTKVREEYVKALGGRPGVLRVMDIHGMWSHEVEDLIRMYKPALIVFDMIDNVKFGGEASNNGQRTDQLLEAMYQWARFMGVKYDCAIIANSQLSADADGVQYPNLPQLKDSKTGKQGAADVIITGGAVNDPSLENSRYIGCTKNKKGRTGQRNSPMVELLLDKDRGRYVEAPQ